MYEIDRDTFGSFLAAQRKEKGYTQKDLAAKLYISDKAVSKWERGLSLPDVQLLIPLAEALDVSVAELLEGRKIEHTTDLDYTQVDSLVKRALSLSEESPQEKHQQRKQRALFFGCCTLIAAAELFLLHLAGISITADAILLPLMPLSFIFGIYFWCFARERLPSFYDENKLDYFSDGFFRLNLPGVHFNNSNWPYIIQAGRLWTVITLLTLPILYFLGCILASKRWMSSDIPNAVLLIAYMGSLFGSIYILGRKYE